MEGHPLTVDRVEVNYGSVRVLKGVSVDVAPGEFIALLGASGCGKTTLLRAVSGFVPVARGRVLVSGRNITRAPPDKRGMAMVFQSYALWPHMTAAQNIGYGLRLRRVPRRELNQRVEEMLTLLGLEGLGDRSVTQLSGGQRQRVALGRALAIGPRILLLDEPLSNLDARIRQTVRHEIKALQKKVGITAIHVTHDREEAMVMADRLVILDVGEVAQVGTPEEVYNRPASPFVASFMGADNVIRLPVEPADGVLRIPSSDDNEAAELPLGEGPDADGVHLVGAISGRGEVAAHFRSEAATLDVGKEPLPGNLVLRGQVSQSSYPGGYYRYAIDVGEKRFMVDDPRRLQVGESVGISLPAASLHLYASGAEWQGTAVDDADRQSADPQDQWRRQIA
ncbi:MAG: ABC transporter ATP-binding protein [Alphaproteobacteria bacterium]